MDSRIPASAVIFTKTEEDKARAAHFYAAGHSVGENFMASCGSGNPSEQIVEDDHQVQECYTYQTRTNYENAVDFEIIDQPESKLCEVNLLPLPSHEVISIDPESDLETSDGDVQVLKNPQVEAAVQTVFSLNQFFVEEAAEKLTILEDLMKTIACAYTEGRYRDPPASVSLEITLLSKEEEDQHMRSFFNSNFLMAIGPTASNKDIMGPSSAIGNGDTVTTETAMSEAFSDKKSSEEPLASSSPEIFNRTVKPAAVSDAKDLAMIEAKSNLCTTVSNIDEEPAAPSVTAKKKKKSKKSGQLPSPPVTPTTAAPDNSKQAPATSSRGYSLCMKVTPILSYLEEHYFHRPLTMLEMDIFLAKMSAAAGGRTWCKKCGGVDHDTSEKPNEEVLCWSLPGMTPFFLKKSTEFCKELVQLEKSINFATLEQKLKTILGPDVFGPAEAFDRCTKSALKSMALKPSDLKLFAEFMSQNGKKKSGSRR